MKTLMRGIGLRPPSFLHSYHKDTLNAISTRFLTSNRSSKHTTRKDGTCQLKSTPMKYRAKSRRRIRVRPVFVDCGHDRQELSYLRT
jgi:hypothetical protein